MKRSTDDDRQRPNRNTSDLPRPQLTGSVVWELLPEAMRKQLSFRLPNHIQDSIPVVGAGRHEVTHDYRPQWVAVSHQHPIAFNQFFHDACIRNAIDTVAAHNRQSIQQHDHERVMRETFGAAMLGHFLPLPPFYDDDAAVVVDARLAEIVRAYKSRVATLMQ